MKKIFILTLLFLTGCAARPGLPYPTAFVTADVPQYPKAWVVNTGNPDATVESGISIKLRTRASLSDARTFYEEALFGDGWSSEAEPPEGWETFYIRVFTKDTEEIQVIIEDQGNEGRSIALLYKKTTEE